MRMEMGFPRELEKAKAERWPLCIPVGVMEYHANQCALGCDALIPYKLLQRFEKERDIVLAPPVWYGPASYCVAGPEKNTIDVNTNAFEEYMYCILRSLVHGGWHNIYIVIEHQCEAINPTESACIMAARKVIFGYFQETRGNGWWGSNEFKDFEETLDSGDNPWNWIKVIPALERDNGKEFPLDHAGKHETSILWASCPEAVDISRVGENTGWFCETAVDASFEHGEQIVSDMLEYWSRTIV